MRDGADAPVAGADIGSARTSRDVPVVDIPGGAGLIGTNTPRMPLDEESPCRPTKIKPFRMMPVAVTNALFGDFVADTGFVTEAERFGWSFVFHAHVPEQITHAQAVVAAQWWRRIDGAYWRAINGPGSEHMLDPDHPAVHISWNDAKAFAKWAGGRLPTEAEWEHAARGGLGDVPYPWGNAEPDDTTHQPCNIWQGDFPEVNTGTDGYQQTAPVQSFQPNGFGLYNMVGNTWEWTADPYKVRSLSKAGRAHAKQMTGMKITKGGSFLCHKSYCYRYRIPARTGNTPDSTTSHQGVRLVFDIRDQADA